MLLAQSTNDLPPEGSFSDPSLRWSEFFRGFGVRKYITGRNRGAPGLFTESNALETSPGLVVVCSRPLRFEDGRARMDLRLSPAGPAIAARVGSGKMVAAWRFSAPIRPRLSMPPSLNNGRSGYRVLTLVPLSAGPQVQPWITGSCPGW